MVLSWFLSLYGPRDWRGVKHIYPGVKIISGLQLWPKHNNLVEDRSTNPIPPASQPFCLRLSTVRSLTGYQAEPSTTSRQNGLKDLFLRRYRAQNFSRFLVDNSKLKLASRFSSVRWCLTWILPSKSESPKMFSFANSSRYLLVRKLNHFWMHVRTDSMQWCLCGYWTLSQNEAGAMGPLIWFAGSPSCLYKIRQ